MIVMTTVKDAIVWIVHPRDFTDIRTEIPYIFNIPKIFRKLVLLFRAPYVASTININGETRGYVVALPLLPEHFKNDRLLTLFRLKQAFRLAMKLGAKKVSVGGMITTYVEREKLGRLFNVDIYDGTGLLAQIIYDKVIATIKELNRGNISVGVIGATTKVGSRLSRSLSQYQQVTNLHLIAKTEKHVQHLKDECSVNSHATIYSHTTPDAIKECDICILTAFIPDGTEIINNLKSHSVFISAIEPISPFVSQINVSRPDVNIIKGVIINAPSLSYGQKDFAIQSGQTYSCLAEAVIADRLVVLKNVAKTMGEYNFQIS